MLPTLLAEEARTLGTVHAKVLGILTTAGLGALAISLVPHALGAEVPTLMGLLASAIAFCLPLAITVIHGLSEYWQTTHGQRGYLTMSLPVRGREVFAAKTLYLLAAALASTVVMVAGLALVLTARGWMGGTTLAQTWDPLLGLLRAVGAPAAWAVVTWLLAELCCLVLMVASVMSVAAQTRWGHLGAGGVVLGLVALYVVNQVLSGAAMVLVPLGIDMGTGRVVARSMLPDLLAGAAQPSVLGLGALPVTLLLTVALAWWAVHSLEHHLSLR